METTMFNWLYDYSTPVAGSILVAIFLITQYLSIIFFRYAFHSWFHREERTNEMLNFIFSNFFVLYGLLIGLLAVAAYQNFSVVDDIVTKEATSINSLYNNIRGYPEPMRGILQTELRDYTRSVIDQSWPLQQKDSINREELHYLTKFGDAMMSFKPTNSGQEILHAEALRQANRCLELRSIRAASVKIGIEEVLWQVLKLRRNLQ